VLQAEDSDVFANHRLKSVWSLETRSMALTTNNLASAFYTSMKLEYVEGGVIRNISCNIGDLPNASHSVTNIWNSTCITNEWILGSGTNQWACSLLTVIPPESTNMLFITHRNLRKTFSVNITTPVPTFGWNGATYLTTKQSVRLFPFAEFTEITNQQPVVLIATNNAGTKQSRFEIIHYAPLPGSLLSGATVRADPISPIARTAIQGIIDEPISLKNYYSQTAAQGHHGFAQYYVFEPGLDPDLTTSQLQKLQQADIQLIYVSVTWSDFDKKTVSMGVLGSDGKFRVW
jgi:hypothetical protein